MLKVTSAAQAGQYIAKAIKSERPVTLTYTRADGVETIRTVEPYGDIRESKAGDLYFKAMDRESGECRSWRLDRITFLTVHRTEFLIKNPTNAKVVFMAKDNGVSTAEHLTAETAVVGQPVMVVRGRQSFPAVFVRVARGGDLRCMDVEFGTYCDHRPTEVFPRTELTAKAA